ncbi:hypothetical protein SAMN05445504_2417 [Burkholderia sp. CF099]|nr:hypothetical protein SAMN05445504_2417 [Burkholderia sp. CF099]
MDKAPELFVEKFDQWAIVELMGHQRIAGRVTEQVIGGTAFVRVDVPQIDQTEGKNPIPGFTKLYGNGAIYAISFVDEATARLVAGQIKLQPIDNWTLERAVMAMNPKAVERLLAPPAAPSHEDEDDEIPL